MSAQVDEDDGVEDDDCGEWAEVLSDQYEQRVVMLKVVRCYHRRVGNAWTTQGAYFFNQSKAGRKGQYMPMNMI